MLDGTLTPAAAGTTSDPVDSATHALADIGSRVKERIVDVGQSARDALHGSRESTASALVSASDGLHAKADTLARSGHDMADSVSRSAHRAAESLEATAHYVRTHGARDIMHDVEEVIGRHPGKSVLVAAAVGFLVARALRSE